MKLQLAYVPGDGRLRHIEAGLEEKIQKFLLSLNIVFFDQLQNHLMSCIFHLAPPLRNRHLLAQNLKEASVGQLDQVRPL